MEARLSHIDRGEVLRYLGYRGERVGAAAEEDLARCEALLMQTARPRLVWKLFEHSADYSLNGCAYRPGGEDIRLLLRDSAHVVLLAATLGTEVEQLIRRTAAKSMADAVILDAAGSAAIENVCDNFCADLERELAPCYLTERFSPGYGDMPLSDQRPFFDALSVSRRIGVTLTESCLMIPQKSVTALIGVSDKPQPRRGRGCASCPRADDCVFRKGGKSCGLF